MKPDLQIHLASESDIPDLASLRGGGDRLEHAMRGYLAGTYSPSFALDTRRVLVARLNGQFAGYISGHRTTRYDCDGELQWLNVAEEFRGQGVADELIRQLFGWFVTESIFRVCVDVSPENLVARRFYSRHGATELNPHFLVWADIRSIEKGWALSPRG
jgi:ribosomal protein S18 acetylase RimI-like enzyme